MMSGVRRVKPEWLAMILSRLLFDTRVRKRYDGHERVVRPDARRHLVTQFPRDHFTKGHVGKAHSRRRRDQRPMSSHQLPDPKANEIHEKMLIGQDGRGVAEKSGLHKIGWPREVESVSLISSRTASRLNEGAEDDRDDYRRSRARSNGQYSEASVYAAGKPFEWRSSVAVALWTTWDGARIALTLRTA